MQGDDLVTENVVSSGDGAGDGDSSAVVVGNELVGCPLAGDVAVVDQTSLGDLEELEGGLVDLGAVAITVGHVSDDRAVVALGPLGPLQLNLTTGLNLGGDRTRGGLLVANNVRASVAAAVDEAEVGSLLSPSDVGGHLRHVVVAVHEEAAVVSTINNSTRHVTVASDHGGRAKQETSNLGDRHLEEVG